MSFQRLHKFFALAAGGALGGLALSASSPAAANVEVGATAGPHTFNKNNELGVEDEVSAPSLRNSVLFGIRLGFTFTPMLGVEAEVGVIPSEGRQLVFDVWTLTYRAHLIAQFRADKPENKVIPFAVLGGGAITVQESDNTTAVDKDTDEMFYVGVGAKYRVENGWGLRLDARAILVPSSDVDDMEESVSSPVLDSEILLSVYKEFGREEIKKIVEQEDEPEPQPDDADGDGIVDGSDQCMNEPEDMDSFQDDDGCPDDDNDGDGVKDEPDECDDQMEDIDQWSDEDGCPDPDNDGDALPDSSDGCPNEAEDTDGFKDDDGCPDPDNDEDGVLDGQDKCADEMETRNGYKDDDGCTDEVPKEIKTFTGVIKGINFKVNSDEILKSSNKTLDAAVKILKQYPDLRLEIQGHTDDTGDAELNRDLSQRRAESVKKYFVDKGIDEARLEAKGYGPDVPLVKKKTKAARAKNRRVEFKLISSLDQPATGGAGDGGGDEE